MPGLSDADALHIHEAGYARHSLDRALIILARCHPELPRDALPDLSVGERDRLLLRARELTLGPMMRGSIDCGGCGEPLEYELRTADLLSMAGPAGAEGEWMIEEGGLRVWYRFPTSRDLAVAVMADDTMSATRILSRRCIVAADRTDRADRTGPDGDAPAEDAPDDIDIDEALLAAIGDRVADAIRTREPLSEVTLDLACPACGGRTRAVFDIGAFFWDELTAIARRLLVEVDTLARVYHWSEAAILALSPTRRRWYLELARG